MPIINRECTNTLKGLVKNFPALAIIGARQSGKSTLLGQICPHKPIFDLENSYDYEKIISDPTFFLEQNKIPVIIDKAQIMPDLFKALRVKIDKSRTTSGQYLLSGSSSPALLKNISESLAGRIAIFELGTFTWAEYSKKKPSPFYKYLIKKQFKKFNFIKKNFNHDELLNLCLNGGYPEIWQKKDKPKFKLIWFENYFKNYIERDIRTLFPTLKFETFKKFIKMLGLASGQFCNASNFARSLDISQPTVKNYFEIANGTFFWRNLPCFSQNLFKTVVKMPKGYIRDSGLLCYLLNIFSIDNLETNPNFGFIWEAFITEQIIKSITNLGIPFKYYTYRTKNQAEIDLILEGPFGLIPIEIKSGSVTKATQLQALKIFIEKYKCKIGFIINRGPEITNLSPNIMQIPAFYL